MHDAFVKVSKREGALDMAENIMYSKRMLGKEMARGSDAPALMGRFVLLK